MDNIKALLLDVDGVMIRLPYYYSFELEKKGYLNAVDNMNAFYNSGNDKLCLEGKADVCNEITPYLEKIGWAGSSVDYFRSQYEFERNYLDNNILLLLTELQGRGIKSYLCTDQDKNRAEFLLNNLKFADLFDGFFISCFIGYRKRDKEFWDYVINELTGKFPGLKPGELLFVDDIQSNIDCAAKSGVQSILFKDMEQFKNELNSIINN